MAKLMSKKTREIVQTVTVLVVVLLFIAFYIVVPLITVPNLAARPDKDKFDDPEYVLENDPAFFADMGLNPDTFRVVTRDNVNLAALFFRPDSANFDTAAGTVILIPPGDTDRTYVAPYVPPLLDAGYDVIAYDQRASGYSGGVWHTAGRYEGDDLVDLIAELNIHEQLIKPVATVGFKVGADAVIRAMSEEQRIDFAIMIAPFLTGAEWLDNRINEEGVIRIPFANTVYYWWFKKISGFPYDKLTVDDIRPLNIRSALLMPNDQLENEATAKLIEITPGNLLQIVEYPSSDSLLITKVVSLIKDYPDFDEQ